MKVGRGTMGWEGGVDRGNKEQDNEGKGSSCGEEEKKKRSLRTHPLLTIIEYERCLKSRGGREEGWKEWEVRVS